MIHPALATEGPIGYALGGGASLGAAHVGALRALDEAGLRAAAVAGTSIGAFVGALHAFGCSVPALEKIALDLQWFQVAGLRLSKLGLLDHSKLGTVLREHIGDVRIEDAPIPLAIVATDIETGERVVLREGPVIPAVLASSAVPAIFQPVVVDGRLLVDGGLVDNLPCGVVGAMGTGPVIASSLFTAAEPREVKTVIDVSLQSLRIAIAEQEQRSRQMADLVIEPDLSRFSPVNTKHAAELIEAGYRAGREALQP